MIKETNRSRSCLDRQKTIISTLINNIELYFSNGFLNSEGLKLIQQMAKISARHCPKYLLYIRKVRKTKTYEDVLKLLNVLQQDLEMN
ncbi:MAG: hypothetical protein QXE81_05070 [Desulfurococcaceae archaeon]